MAGRRGGVVVPISTEFNSRGIAEANKQLGAFGKTAGKSMMGIGAALGAAFSVSAIVNQFKTLALAAAEDQKSMVALGRTMSNLGMGAAATQVEAFITKTMMATGVADDQLRPAFARLIRSTGDITESQKALNIALDISTATGKDLDTVANGLGKAYDGNAASLGRLGLGLDKALLKSGDMAKITGVLTEKFGGQAAAAAGTYAGQIQRLNVAVAEAQETIGYALLNSLDKTNKSLGGTDGFVQLITVAGDKAAALVIGVSAVVQPIMDFTAAVTQASGAMSGPSGFIDGLLRIGAVVGGPFGAALNDVVGLGKDINAENQKQAQSIAAASSRYTAYANALRGVKSDADAATAATDRQRSAVDKLQASLDRLNGKNRSVIGARLNLRQLRRNGPGATGERKGPDGKVLKFTTRDDRIAFGLQYAQGAEDLSRALADRGQFGAARRSLTGGRRYLTGLLGSAMAGEILSTPAWLDRGDSAQRAAGQRYATGAGTTNNYYFNGNLLVRDLAEAAQQAQRTARLKALGRGASASAMRYAEMAAAS